MSGGVDSSVAALMLVRQGHDVFGVTMDVWSTDGVRSEASGVRGGKSGCAAVDDAGSVAARLGIPHHLLPMRPVFERAVVEPFASEYARGRTPNPCVRCNQLVKFGELLSLAREMGAERLATGHHAIIRDVKGRRALARGADDTKDQTYFLFRLTSADLELIEMPIGGLPKTRVRELARAAGLPTADRPESQDICFIPEGDIGGLLRRSAPGALEPGPILDAEGHVVGRHRGIGLYTVGQRARLGLSRARPTYVVRIDASRNAIVVGDEGDLYSTSLSARELCWASREAPPLVFRADAKIRYATPAAPCTVRWSDEEARVDFDEPQRAMAPGQAVVLYDGDVVMGGGTIWASE